MEWPAHQLLRQTCKHHGPLIESEDVSVCSSSVHNAADASAPSLHSHSGKFCTTCSSTSSLPMLPYYKQHSGVDSLAAAAAVGGVPSGGRHRRKRKDWRQKCVSYSRLGGWYVLGAEILGTIILIALCVVAAEQARSMSEQVETVALAALARSNPRAICVNASTDTVQGRIVTGINLQLVPGNFKDPHGRHWRRASIEAGTRSPCGLWNFPASSHDIPLDVVFTQNMLAAMFKCGVVHGAYHSSDLPAFILRRCSGCRSDIGSTATTAPSAPAAAAAAAAAGHNASAVVGHGGAVFAESDDITHARAHPGLESKAAQYHLLHVFNGTLSAEQLVQLYGSGYAASLPANDSAAASWINATERLLMFANDDFLPGLEAIPHSLDQALDASRVSSEFVGLVGQLPMPQPLQWAEASLYLSEEQWHAAADHSRRHAHDPRAVPPGTLRVDVFHTAPYSSWLDGGGPGGIAKPPGIGGGAARPPAQHISSVYLDLAQQTAKTAQCMAESAGLATKLLRSARYTLRAPNGTVVHGVRPDAANLTFDQLWLRLDANVDAARPYACAEGVDVTSADATAYLTRLDAYKSTAKSQYRTTIFISMHHQTAEDIYAVYTGALGAVFGSMALLVSTLFVYAIALGQKAFADCQQDAAADEHPE